MTTAETTTGLSVLLAGLTFPEAPRWRDGKLWFSDFYSFRVMTVDLQGHSELVVDVPNRPSGLGWTPSGDFLIVSMLDHKLFRLVSGKLELYSDIGVHATGPSNDMVIDPLGRAYIGNFGFDRHAGASPRSASLIRVDPDGSVSKVADELMFPNGMAITPDGRQLIVAESLEYRLTSFDILPDGSLTNRRLFASVSPVYPDGICLDAEGAVWVSHARGNELIRVFDGGKVQRKISTGDRRSFACMLGGEDRKTLFVCTNTDSGPHMGQKRDGRIETIRVDVPGAGLP
jgi:sugar lactone lactonase YvrE